jgi:hypothetical protein
MALAAEAWPRREAVGAEQFFSGAKAMAARVGQERKARGGTESRTAYHIVMGLAQFGSCRAKLSTQCGTTKT